MGTDALLQLRTELKNLSLHEVDFAVGDAFVSRLGDIKQQIDRLDTSGEPWLAEWLSAEHLKGGMLWTAAKTNWAKEQSSGADSTFNIHTRARLVQLFNAWATVCAARVESYQRSGRTAADVAEWNADLQRFQHDAVHNPRKIFKAQ